MATGLDLGFVMIWVDDVQRAIRFYQAIGLRHRFTVDTQLGPFAEFGTEAGGAGSDAGSVRLCFGDVQEARKRHGADLRPMFEQSTFELVLVHDDVEAVWQAAMEAGATPVHEPQPQPCWDTLAAWFRDPNGILVSVVERLEPRDMARKLVDKGGDEAADVIFAAARDEAAMRPEADIEARVRVEDFLRQIPDERLGAIFGGAGLASMEAALIERSLEM